MIKYLSNFILIIFLIYSLVLICIYIFQRKIIYHPFVNSYSQSQKEFTFKEVSIKTEDNLKLNAWFHEKDLKNKKTLLFFHGNAGDLSNRVYKLNILRNLDINFLILAYRGYSGI